MHSAEKGSPYPPDSGKRALRRKFLAVRAGFTEHDVQKSAGLLARHALGLPEVARAGTVAAYVSVGGEPGTGDLLDALRARGVRVLLPVLRADDDLDWGVYRGPGSLVSAGRAGRITLREPDGERLGPEGILAADVVLLPGLAVDARGMRLGRGGGSYDRVLARLAGAGADPALVVLLYDAEVVERVPCEAHDRPVHAAVTPSGTRRF